MLVIDLKTENLLYRLTRSCGKQTDHGAFQYSLEHDGQHFHS